MKPLKLFIDRYLDLTNLNHLNTSQNKTRNGGRRKEKKKQLSLNLVSPFSRGTVLLKLGIRACILFDLCLNRGIRHSVNPVLFIFPLKRGWYIWPRFFKSVCSEYFKTVVCKLYHEQNHLKGLSNSRFPEPTSRISNRSG